MECKTLTEEQQRMLLELARKTLSCYLTTGIKPKIEVPEDDALRSPAAVFVTLTLAGKLRGCIGHTVAQMPLYEAVSEMAILSATQDPRFPPLQPHELDNVVIEISVLSEFLPLQSPEKIQIGKHGLYIRCGGRAGLLLPQVAVEYNWDKYEFLKHTCYKAGLPGDAYLDKSAQIFYFTAQVFKESP